jgi:hypothetical protein
VHYKRRLATLELESERLRVSVMDAEKYVKLMETSNKKVRVRVRVRVMLGVRVRVRFRLRVGVRVGVRVEVLSRNDIHLTRTRALAVTLSTTLTKPDLGEATSVGGASGLAKCGAKCTVAFAGSHKRRAGIKRRYYERQLGLMKVQPYMLFEIANKP